MKAPKKITLSATTTNVVGKFSVTIQNLGDHPEVIQSLSDLTNLGTVTIQSLSNCPSFLATMVPPKGTFPMTLAPQKKLNLTFVAHFDCANDPAATAKGVAHNDYRTIVDLAPDTVPSNDTCPRPPNPATGDKGCGNKDPVTKQPGADVFTDVVVKP
jgi:hypothetical protein